MKYTEYLKLCNVESVDDLTYEQLAEFFIHGNSSTWNKFEASLIMDSDRAFGYPIDKEKCMEIMRKAMMTGKSFSIGLITGEGVYENPDEYRSSYLTYNVF